MEDKNLGLTDREIELTKLALDELLNRPKSCPQCQSQTEGRLWRESRGKITCPVCGFVLEYNQRATY